MDLRNRNEPVALRAAKLKLDQEELTLQGQHNLPRIELLSSASVAQDTVSSHLWMSSLCS